MKVSSLFLLTIGFLTAIPFASADDLSQRFENPPLATRPRCYWYWMDGNISKEGITKDLEAMKRVGIGGAYIGVISGQSGSPPKPEPKALTDPWWNFIEHAIREGSRLGIDIGLFNSPGWSQSGGPWVKPDQAMRHLTLTETRVSGPSRFSEKLSAPQAPYQDVCVQAFPVPASDGIFAPITKKTPKSILFDSKESFTARSLTVLPTGAINVAAELFASDDGKEFRSLRKFAIDRHNLKPGVGPVALAPITISLPATSAKFFRLDFSAACDPGEVQLSSAARIEDYAGKSLQKVFQDPLPPPNFYSWPDQPEPDQVDLAIAPDKVIDLTAKMKPDGTLVWEVPAGDWIIQRYVMVPTGTKNGPAPVEATGLEVDKINRDALASHFDAYVGNLLKRMPAEDRKAWKYVVGDSYEMGPQNWTDGFAAAFQKRYGYDPYRYLPVLSGRVVASADKSNRFLWDLRRFVADRVAYEYVGALRELCHANGLKLWLENYGHWGFPAEFLQYGGQSDELSGEFWVTGALGTVELRDASSAAHIYGKNVVWAEAFTGGPAFSNSPRDLKARGDWAFGHGINQFTLHVYIHQPDDKKPGINAWFGTEFNRNNTWFEQSKSWITYLRRCSVMLQAGHPVADVAYYIGEDAPKMSATTDPSLPPGYDYDFINAEVIENRLSVKDGRFVLPDGMSYKLLVLPKSAHMRPAVLEKIKQLVDAGGKVVGPAPDSSPSLENFPQADVEVEHLAASLWPTGKIMKSSDFANVLTELGTPPDVIAPNGIIWKHRHEADRDIYFVSNQKNAARTATLSFRVTGKPTALWWPETGKIQQVPSVDQNGRSSLNINFSPAGSVFVVFGESPMGKPILTSETTDTAITTPWTLEFPTKKFENVQLTSWTENDIPEIKYYSGTATYTTSFQVTAEDTTKPTLLDLGRVGALATVTLNGHSFPTAWKPPYQIDISGHLNDGENTLRVSVINNWNNRLVGDLALPKDQRQTSLTADTVKPNTPLQPSGLLGPVKLIQSH